MRMRTSYPCVYLCENRSRDVPFTWNTYLMMVESGSDVSWSCVKNQSTSFNNQTLSFSFYCIFTKNIWRLLNTSTVFGIRNGAHIKNSGKQLGNLMATAKTLLQNSDVIGWIRTNNRAARAAGTSVHLFDTACQTTTWKSKSMTLCLSNNSCSLIESILRPFRTNQKHRRTTGPSAKF